MYTAATTTHERTAGAIRVIIYLHNKKQNSAPGKSGGFFITKVSGM